MSHHSWECSAYKMVLACPEPFGVLDSGESVEKFVLTNHNGMRVVLINYGATVVSIEVPNRNGSKTDVALGFDDLDGYVSPVNPYFGCIVGRVANRVADGRFTLDNQVYVLAKNTAATSLHGGARGFDKLVWNWHLDKSRNGICFSLLSRDGDEGYPGDLIANVSYFLSEDNGLMVHFRAMATKPTPVNLANHLYFNLGGHSSGDIKKHRVILDADCYLPMDNDTMIPTGDIPTVEKTPFDLRSGRVLESFLGDDGPPAGGDVRGFDHCFVVSSRGPVREQLQRFCRILCPSSGIYLEGFTDQPGVQFYTGNFLPSDGSLTGKSNATYAQYGGFCLETQKFPDAINQRKFSDNSVLRPGDVYEHRVVYKFGVDPEPPAVSRM